MQDTKERIITLAEELIKTKGFNAFSYKDISDPLEIKNAAIHYYFPTKTDLGVAVLEQYLKSFTFHTAKWAELPEDKQLKQLFDTFSRASKDKFICLMGSLSPDYDTLQPAMQEQVSNMASAIVQWVASCLERGRSKGLFRFEGEAYDRALLVQSNLLASLLLSRVMGNKVFGKMSSRLMKDLLVDNTKK
ncbi:TetR/AcrR family transcriptional regulator [Chitinophaga tropicalis]|uniref:TetR family transcriptional regulator n=1 Tax=Chitinophaga tropicalis TaxID=2683588 RepID=A0A7K1U3K9_9BACT|nr:TetR/AcrR family transcriptional regulator [Chitinophaga tropicalis]MVT08938.1 TetR family transcriptional regulator [Chitinophaga tropicalis]